MQRGFGPFPEVITGQTNTTTTRGVHEVANFSLVPADDDDIEIETTDEATTAAPPPREPDDFWSLAPREPIRAPARSGRTRLYLVIGGIALLAFALGLLMPTPDGFELTEDNSEEEAAAELPQIEVPVGWSVTPLVIRNPTEIPEDELITLVGELLTAAADATDSSDARVTPQLLVCDPARHPGLLSANPQLTQQDLDKLSAVLC
jgi:hypothetical protein